MTQDSTTYYVWIGGSCDYGHKERAGGAAIIVEHDGGIISRDVIADLHTTEFRMMLTLLVKVMNELPEGSDILFLTNVAYIQNFDKELTPKSANPDLIVQCIESKKRHNSVSVKIVQYHKSPLLIETHDTSTEAMKKLRTKYNRQAKDQRNSKVTLCIMILVMMLISACSSNKKTHTTSDTEQKDSVTYEITPSSSETTDAQNTSIFDELADNMVCIEVDTGSFYICKYEVTQALWKEVMGNNPSEMQGDDLPVEQVSWNDCQAFIAKLNELTGKHYRLPTEAEWEYACKGGKYTKGFKYSGSNNIDDVAWYDENSEGKTHPIGQKQPNELGLYDMSGNVWEWCQDMHEGTGMCRGGSWIHHARYCDPSLPNETPQSFSINCIGLRLTQQPFNIR